ncbi:MAG: hypothetical protein M1834_002812 [Cirrosporium novae-zelandiae]|nr:MAG: hypothetical protein M1834_002812 [Cirrosporium novae-zelandiae]
MARFSTTTTEVSSAARWDPTYNCRKVSSTHDFRSTSHHEMQYKADSVGDTVTLPSGTMLSSILTNATNLGDDVFSEDGPTNALECYTADLTGMKHAMFTLTGTMGNQVSLRSLLKQPPYSVICDFRSHIFAHECGMTSMFSQAHLIPIMPDMTKRAYLVLEDIIPYIVPDDGDLHGSPTKVICIENTISGKVVPVQEITRISQYAKERGIMVHMDGARLWNACYAPAEESLAPAAAAEAATKLLRAYCAAVDTVTLCFSKSLGAPSGSIVLSNSSSFIDRARHFRKALGGGLRQTGILASPARVAIDETFLSGEHMRDANAIAKRIEKIWIKLGGDIQIGLNQETNMVWLDLQKAGIKDQDFVNAAKEEGVSVLDGRIVTHHQISLRAVDALERVFIRVLAGKNTDAQL